MKKGEHKIERGGDHEKAEGEGSGEARIMMLYITNK